MSSNDDDNSKDKDTNEQQPESQGWTELGAAWRGASAESGEGARIADRFGAALDVKTVRERAEKFAKTIRRRNAIEYVAGVILILFSIRGAIAAKTWLMMIGGVGMALGAAFVLAVLYIRGSNRPAPDASAPTTVVLTHERAELDRQAGLLERVWLWYLMPFVPTMLAIYTDALLEALRKGTSIYRPIGLFLLTIAVFVGIHFINMRAARKLRAQRQKLGD